MAKKRIEADDRMETREGAAPTSAVLPPGYVVLENLQPNELGITLTDGTHISAGPRRGHNRTKAIPKKLLPPHVKGMVNRGEVRIIDASGGSK